MVSKNNIEKNIFKNYIFTLFNNLQLQQGIWMIYLGAKGMSLVELGMLEGLFHITSFIMEVPTGAVADIYGRKASRVLGRVCAIIGLVLLLIAENFYMFALSFIVQAISYNLESGAGEALVYDSLKEINKENEYIKVNKNIEVIFQVASIISFLLGGYLASKSYILAFMVGGVFLTFALIESFNFYEPNIGRVKRNIKNPFKVIKIQLIDGLKVLKGDRKLIFFILFIEINSVFSANIFYYIQNYWKGNNFGEFTIGIVLAIASLISAIVALYIDKLEKILKEKRILLFMPIINTVCIWGIASTRFSVIFFIINEVVLSILMVVLSDYINRLIPSRTRATVLSLQSMVYSLFMIISFPMIGKIGDVFSLRVSFKLLAISASILVVINTGVILKNIIKNPFTAFKQ